MMTNHVENFESKDESSIEKGGERQLNLGTESPQRPPPKPNALVGKRHVFVFMGFLGLCTVYMMRTNLSVAIVDMIKPHTQPTNNDSSSNSALVSFLSQQQQKSDYYSVWERSDNNTDGFCDPGETDANSTTGNENGFDWNQDQKGLILGAFYWGYIVTQIPGGILAERYGGKIVFGTGIALTTLCCLLTPLAAHGGVGTMIAIRVMTGLSEGVTYPTANSMISKWVPSDERTRLGAFVLAGTQFGTVIALPLSGWLCSLNWLDGWPLAFYVPGIFGVLWLVGWLFLVSDNPQVHPTISQEEKLYILATTGASTKRKSVKETPWLSIFGSVHFWAILVAHFGHNWGFTMLLTELPSYMNEVLHFDLKANGLLSALPYLAMWLFSMVFSTTADALRRNNILSTTVTRKVFTSIGLLLPACGLIGASYTGCDRVATLVLLTLATGFNGAVYSGFLLNHIDIASNHAGSMMGLTNCVSNTCGFIAPSVVSAIVYTTGSLSQWQTVFFLSAGIYFSTDLFYVIFGTGVEQPWNKMASVEPATEDIKSNDIITIDGISIINVDGASNEAFADGDKSE